MNEGDYVNEDHIHEFAKALIWSDEYVEDGCNGANENGTENSISRRPSTDYFSRKLSVDSSRQGKRPDLIISKSDWYPINDPLPVSSKNNSNPTIKNAAIKQRKLRNEYRSSFSYHMLRWPILLFITFWIVVLCVMYGVVRIYVALSEYLFTWIGEQKRLRQKLRDSVTYEEWIENAIKLDKYLTLDRWSLNPKFSYYDYKTINLTIQTIKRLRRQQNDVELMLVLQSCLKSNFAGIENRQLYSHRYFGTKNLIQTYVNTVVDSINYITNSEKIPLHSKRHFFKIVSKNYGKTALVLSGGACFAYTHFGIVKALLDQDLLPNIISGTSGGGLIAALACTRSNEELKELLVPQLAKKITACEDPWYVWIPRFWRTGARFDAVSWAKKANFFTRGSTTFQEAFERTGRKLNISTVPADPHSPVILCNSITSPNCIIWSALLASSAVPGILNPVVLMMKSHAGEIVPFSLGNKWRDGSLRTDIPIDALNTYYNVNFSVVSQVNPHISLFFFAPKGTVGRPVARRKVSKGKYSSLRGGFIATALEQLFKLEITKWLQMVKTLDLLPHFLEQDWSNIWLQRFTGSITIWPRNKLKDFWYILSDPTEERLGEMILKGERSMFPRILFIRNRIAIERAIEEGRKASKLSTKINNTIDLATGGNDFQFHSVEYDDDSDFEDHEYEAESSDCPPQYSNTDPNSEYLTDTTNTTVEEDEEVNESDTGRTSGEADAGEALMRNRRNTIF